MTTPHPVAVGVAAVLLLAACAPDVDPAVPAAPSSDTAPGAPATEAASPAAPSPSSAATLPAEDPDDVDGVHTEDFLPLPAQLGDAHRLRVDADPDHHRVAGVYRDEADPADVALTITLPTRADGATVPARTFSEDAPVKAWSALVAKVGSRTPRPDQFMHSSGPGRVDWRCVADPGTEGDGDVAKCQTIAHGRTVHVEYAGQGAGDIEALTARIEPTLDEVAAYLTPLLGGSADTPEQQDEPAEAPEDAAATDPAG